MTIIRKPQLAVAKAVPHFSRTMLVKKHRLRELGYIHTMTLYGTVFQRGTLRYKRVEILSKYPIKQIHNAFLYEVMVRQDFSRPAVQAYHARYPMLDQAKFKGPPKEDYLVLTWNELKAGVYVAEPGQWVEYDQET